MSVLGLVVVYILAAVWTVPVAIATLIYALFFSARFIHQKHRPHPSHALKQFQHGFLDLHDGTIRIHYVEAGDPNRPLLLLVHGFPEFWYSWRHQIAEFQQDYHVVAIDLRGYGESSKPASINAYALPTLVEDLRQVITALGRKKCYLVSHDWGASVAWRFALKHPDMIEKLVIMNCPHPKASTNLPTAAKVKQLLKTWYMFFFQCPYLPETVLRANDLEILIRLLKGPRGGCTNPDAFTQEDEEAWKYTFQQPHALTPPINYYRANIGRLPAKDTDGDVVKPPTLIVWGSKDVVLGEDLAHSSLQFCQQGSLRVLEGVSHWSQFDHPTLCNQVIRDYLAK